MSRLSILTVTAPSLDAAPVRRVRHELRDGLAVMAFSAVTSTAVAVGMLLLSRLVVGSGN